MIKRLMYLLIGTVILTIVIASFGSLLSTRKAFDLQANFHKTIAVAPSTAWLLQEYDIGTNDAIKIDGIYSMEYESDYAQLNIKGKQIVIRDLLSIQVHLAKDNLVKDMERDLLQANTYEHSEVLFLEHQQIPDFFSTVVIGPIKISSDKHRGELYLPNIAVLSETVETPKVFFYDFNKNLSDLVAVNAILRPFDDPRKVLVVMPMNDFKVILTDSSGQTRSSPVFRGQFMRMKDFHFISARPWLDSKLEEQAEEMINPVLGVPSKITIKGESVNSIKLKGFDGEFKIEREAITQNERNVQWEIRGAESPLITVNMQTLEPQQVLVEVQFRAQVRDLIVDNRSVRGFSEHFAKNLLSIWSNPYLVGILSTVYAALILYWVTKTKRGKKTRRRRRS